MLNLNHDHILPIGFRDLGYGASDALEGYLITFGIK